MSTKYSSNSVSEDFPLYHSEKIPVYCPPKEIKRQKNISELRIMISNEHPDIFRIRGLKEGSYNNPFLKEVLKVDRDEYYKKIQEIGKKVKLIDAIKSSRKYSQDQKYLSLINNDSYYKKNKLIELSPTNRQEKPDSCTLSLENKDNFLNTALRTLNREREKFSRNNTKNNIDLDKMEKIGYNYIINKDDINKIKTLNYDFDIDKSSYITNINNFKLSALLKDDENKKFFYPRKPVYNLNPINNIKIKINPPPYIFPKWSKFSENHFVLSHTKNGLSKKGGLFTEFVDRNFDKIKVINNDIKKRLKEKKEVEEKMKKLKYYYDEENNNINRRNSFKMLIPSKSLTKTWFSENKSENNLLLDKIKRLSLKNKSHRNLFDLNILEKK